MDILSQEFTLVLIGSAFFIIVAVGIIVLFLVYQKKQLELLIQKKELENQFQQELLNARLEVHENTLNQVSQEIHDNLGQVLSFVNLNLNKAVTTPADYEITISNTKELIQRAIQDLRNLSKTLNSQYITKTLLSESINHDLNIINQSGACKAQMLVKGLEEDFDEQKKLIVYRMVQEILNNAIKHSKANLLKVNLSYEDSKLNLLVEDNGVGIDNNRSTSKNSGTGLNNLFVRAKLVGATFEIANGEISGTRATLELPLSLRD